MRDLDHLRQHLLDLDGRGYKSYKEIGGTYSFPEFTLHVDHVQGDPFADPSRLRVQVSQELAAYPASTFANKSRTNGLCTYLASQFSETARRLSRNRGSGKSGLIEIDAPGQQILERTCLSVDERQVEARFVVGLPAAGRRIRGAEAAAMLCDDVPAIVAASLKYSSNDEATASRYVETSEDADFLRHHLTAADLVAFVANGSCLPRHSGVDDRPLQEAVPFRSPPELEVTVDLPNAGPTPGMGIPVGVTLVVGGGFHGKSTLLNALERGVYNHVPGDGREHVVTRPLAMKIRAEDGRSVAGVNISPFIDDLPFGRTTCEFSTENASGSTSQAANIVEALELSADLLLIDEDTAATNFMIRDARMRALIQMEPITPFIDRVGALFTERGASTILVMGGSGDYFAVADTVIAMENYQPRLATAQAKALAGADPASAENRPPPSFHPAARIPVPESFNPVDPARGRRSERVKATSIRSLLVGREPVDLAALSQLVSPSQTRAVAAALLYLWRTYMDGKRSVAEGVTLVLRDVERDGLDLIAPHLVGDMALFRSLELAAALNRYHPLRIGRRG